MRSRVAPKGVEPRRGVVSLMQLFVFAKQTEQKLATHLNICHKVLRGGAGQGKRGEAEMHRKTFSLEQTLSREKRHKKKTSPDDAATFYDPSKAQNNISILSTDCVCVCVTVCVCVCVGVHVFVAN